MKALKYFILVLALLVSLPSEARTVHRWQAELNDSVVLMLNTNRTPAEVLTTLTQESRDYFIWRHGWETPVEYNRTLVINAIYDPELVKADRRTIDNLAIQYRQKVPRVFQARLDSHPHPYRKFTQEDIDRIKSHSL